MPTVILNSDQTDQVVVEALQDDIVTVLSCCTEDFSLNGEYTEFVNINHLIGVLEYYTNKDDMDDFINKVTALFPNAQKVFLDYYRGAK